MPPIPNEYKLVQKTKNVQGEKGQE